MKASMAKKDDEARALRERMKEQEESVLEKCSQMIVLAQDEEKEEEKVQEKEEEKEKEKEEEKEKEKEEEEKKEDEKKEDEKKEDEKKEEENEEKVEAWREKKHVTMAKSFQAITAALHEQHALEPDSEGSSEEANPNLNPDLNPNWTMKVPLMEEKRS